jgi:hypothetical protein
MPNRELPAWVFYVASFVFPFFGITYGILELCKPEAEHRKRGKTSLILALAAVVLICAGATAYMAWGLRTDFAPLMPS